MPPSELSYNSSGSTTQQTGTYYTNGFSEGFLAHNKNTMLNNTWIKTDYKVIGYKCNKRNNNNMQEIGDIDFICRITKDTWSRNLFPITSRSNNIEIKANTLVLIEVTSMAGETAIQQIDKKTNMTKVQHKLNFFNNLFMYNTRNLARDGINISEKDNVLVLFIYNGLDPVEMQNAFTSTQFHSLVVHLPFITCQEWKLSISIDILQNEKMKAEKDKMKAEKDKMKAEKDKMKAMVRAEIAEKVLQKILKKRKVLEKEKETNESILN